MNTMYSTLLQLPLFQGLSQEDFTNILGKVKLEFVKYKPQEIIVNAGSSCQSLIFILKGDIASVATSADKLLTYTEHLKATYLIEPESLFGPQPRYKASYKAISTINILKIDKSFLFKELLRYEIFMLNYLNYTSNRTQNLYHRIWQNPLGGVTGKLIYFILQHAEKPEGRKILEIKMEDLAHLLDDTRLNISRALNSLQDSNLIHLSRGTIEVPDASKLMKVIL